jgi:hypothetical protein
MFNQYLRFNLKDLKAYRYFDNNSYCNSCCNSYGSLLVMLRCKQTRILQSSKSLRPESAVVKGMCLHVCTSHNGQLRPAKNSIEIKVGDLEFLLKLLLGQKRSLRLGSVLGHNSSSYEDQTCCNKSPDFAYLT